MEDFGVREREAPRLKDEINVSPLVCPSDIRDTCGQSHLLGPPGKTGQDSDRKTAKSRPRVSSVINAPLKIERGYSDSVLSRISSCSSSRPYRGK